MPSTTPEPAAEHPVAARLNAKARAYFAAHDLRRAELLAEIPMALAMAGRPVPANKVIAAVAGRVAAWPTVEHAWAVFQIDGSDPDLMAVHACLHDYMKALESFRIAGPSDAQVAADAQRVGAQARAA